MKYITPHLTTQRLVLKRGCLEDFQKVYEYDFTKLMDIAGEFEFVKLNPEKIKGFELYADEDNALNWIIYLKDGMLPIGDLIADRVNAELNSIELSYNLHPSFWGKQYMMEAAYKAMEYLFSIGFDNIVCSYDEGNIKSQRVIEKMGFSLFQVKHNSWEKNGIAITTYQYIMSKDCFEKRHNQTTRACSHYPK